MNHNPPKPMNRSLNRTRIAADRGPWLSERSAKVTSQSGEDGILAAILDRIEEPSKWCVEFGAWDGIHLSNTSNLVANRGYSAVLIEGDPERFIDLTANVRGNDKVHTFRRLVGWGDADGLDAILAETPIPKDFGILSIDIDGNDYHVWHAVRTYRARVVVIEFNPTIPNAVDFVQSADPDVNQGSSVRALTRLANSKGYELVATTATNAFFVDRLQFALLNIEDTSLEIMRTDESWVTHLFVGYDGSIHLDGCRIAPWHFLPITSHAVQVVPRLLRKFPESYGRTLRGALVVYRLWAWLTSGRIREDIIPRVIERRRRRSTGNPTSG